MKHTTENRKKREIEGDSLRNRSGCRVSELRRSTKSKQACITNARAAHCSIPELLVEPVQLAQALPPQERFDLEEALAASGFLPHARRARQEVLDRKSFWDRPCRHMLRRKRARSHDFFMFLKRNRSEPSLQAGSRHTVCLLLHFLFPCAREGLEVRL